MSSPKKELPFSSIEELMEVVGYSREEAEAQWKLWNYQPPTDPEELRRHANKASRYEHGMRMLNTRKADGEINQQEYSDLEHDLYRDIYSPDSD